MLLVITTRTLWLQTNVRFAWKHAEKEAVVESVKGPIAKNAVNLFFSFRSSICSNEKSFRRFSLYRRDHSRPLALKSATSSGMSPLPKGIVPAIAEICPLWSNIGALPPALASSAFLEEGFSLYRISDPSPYSCQRMHSLVKENRMFLICTTFGLNEHDFEWI